MENKKTIVGIIIVLILIIGLVGVSYVYSNYNKEQVDLLTNETNKLLKSDIIVEEIDLEIKTEKNYAVVEKSIKEYLRKIKNIYSNLDEIYNQIKPDDIFSAQNINDGNYEEVDQIIADYKQKAKDGLLEYKELIKEENIQKSIKEKNINIRTKYYIELYNTAMLSEVMKEKYTLLERQIEKKKDEVLYKLAKLEKMEEYLKENEEYWTIKDGKIQFTNNNKMIEYYSLFNKVEN